MTEDIVCKSLTLIDHNGHAIARLSESNGNPLLTLCRPKGPEINAAVYEHGASIDIFGGQDPGGKVSLSVERGTAFITMFGASGLPVISVAGHVVPVLGVYLQGKKWIEMTLDVERGALVIKAAGKEVVIGLPADD